MPGIDHPEAKALNDEEYREKKAYRAWYWRRETHLLVIWLILGVSCLNTHGDLAHALYVATTLFTFYCLWWRFKTPGPEHLEPRVEDYPEALRFNRYMNLVDLKGCGPRTAERILAKVDAGEILTEREQQFWNKARVRGSWKKQ
mgnify:FL=1|tara:strand:- start:121 stop:552 length:432 start_codon:yes stop_codon:yes gene_type:complete